MRLRTTLPLCAAALSCVLSLPACGDGGAAPDGPRITAGPTAGSIALPFSLHADGRGKSAVGRIALDGGAGTLVLDGRTMSAATTARVAFAGETVYQVIAVAEDRWAVAWLYCAKGSLTGVYFESTDRASIASEPAAGACDDLPVHTEVQVAFPGFDMPVPGAPGGAAFTIDGAAVAYDGSGPGKIVVGGRSLALYPFSRVDCTKGCGDFGWYELHSILWDAEERRASFGILYLYEDARWPIELAYTLTLPTLGTYGDAIAFPNAHWH